MNPKFYTEEFRAFKYLQCSPDRVEYFKTTAKAINLIQPWDETRDRDFVWPHRIEFIEQILDLRNDTLYIVFAGILSDKNIYEATNLITVDRPAIFSKNPLLMWDTEEITGFHPDLENVDISGPCLVDGNSSTDAGFNPQTRVFRLNSLPVVPHAKSDFTELFYDKATAEKYAKALTDFLRHKMDAISAFSWLI